MPLEWNPFTPTTLPNFGKLCVFRMRKSTMHYVSKDWNALYPKIAYDCVAGVVECSVDGWGKHVAKCVVAVYPDPAYKRPVLSARYRLSDVEFWAYLA